MVWALVLVPLGAAAVASVAGRAPRALVVGAVGALTATVAAAATIAFGAYEPVSWTWGPRLTISLDPDGFALVMAVLVPSIALPVVGYALAVEREGRTRLVALLVAFVGAMELLVVSADLLTLLIAWELVGAFSWALIAHYHRDEDNGRKAGHAFITTRFGDLGLYAAAALAFGSTGGFDFAAIERIEGPALHVIAGGILVAAAAKSAQFPFAPWLFSAMAGPTPVSALLHSATMVAAGAFLLIRLGPFLGSVGWLAPATAALGIVTALTGGVVAALHGHAKKVLAASTSAQYGLMFAAVGAGATAAAGAHLVAHAALKALLFLGAGMAMHASGGSRLADMRLGRALPAAAALSGVGALALAAVPPLGAAWTKEEIVAAAFHYSPWLGAGVSVAGALSAFYAARYHLLAFGRNSVRPVWHRPARVEGAALASLALASVALGALWLPGADAIVESAVGGELIGGTSRELAVGLALVAVAGLSAWAAARAGRLASMGSGAVGRRLEEWYGVPSLVRALVVDPVLALARGLARFDDRVIDAGVRAAAALARLGARLVSVRVEVGVDAVVRAVAGATLGAAAGSRAADEHAVDGAVEGLAGGIGRLGRRARRLQTGLSHHYYVVASVGLVVLVGALALTR